MKYLLLLLLLISFEGFSQSKKIYYFDENGKPSTETIFKKTEVDGNKIIRYFDVDTAYIAKIYLFENYAKLNPNHLDSIKKHLENLSGKKLDASKPIVISYISANDPANIDPEYKTVNIYETSKWKESKKLMKRTDINLLWLQHPDNKSQINRYNLTGLMI
ncbi:hypothetical protein HYN59_10275 [Flavobacterium album]|uniref:Uncharacterized protein n=1 Tax=Flavobacterium album TaxID=2175091 RepID=A0A2S1QYR1_9FLAO|nr:hypothetical protein [Flavobacterium album]AWH85479.1 hypothetical protein HYN59_10275 [Flavobacterium album]